MRARGFVSLSFFLVGLLACAPAVKVSLKTEGLSILKGVWEGQRDITFGRLAFQDPSVLEIYNDTVPLKGKFTLFFQQEQDPRIFPFDQGQIDPEGNLVIRLNEETALRLALYREENKMKLAGSYYLKLNEGKITLYRK